MNREDLLRILDLKGKEAPAQEAETLEVTTVETSPPREPSSPTVLKLDGWGLSRGADLLAESPRLQATQLDAHAVADFHGAAFEVEPVLQDQCQDEARHQFLEQLLQTPAYRALHAVTRLDPLAAGIAATAFAEEFVASRGEEENGSRKETLDQEMATLRAVGRAISEASREVQECQETAAALGLGPGSPGSNDAQAIASLFRRVRNSPVLRRICELAGRFRRLAQSRQRRRTVHGMDDLVGVVQGGNLAHLLPGELARLAVEELADDLLRRLVERQALCRQYQALEPVGKGPIVVVVDESGSMAGSRVETAKALALALAWIARQQRRWCALVAYSGSSGERLLALPPGRWNEVQLLDWLEAFIGRGSDLDLPLRELPEYFQRLRCPEGITDVIAITDAQLRIPASVQESFLNWKREKQVRMVSLVVRSQPGDLSAISDEVHRVEQLDIETEGVGRVLSI